MFCRLPSLGGLFPKAKEQPCGDPIRVQTANNTETTLDGGISFSTTVILLAGCSWGSTGLQPKSFLGP